MKSEIPYVLKGIYAWNAYKNHTAGGWRLEGKIYRIKNKRALDSIFLIMGVILLLCLLLLPDRNIVVGIIAITGVLGMIIFGALAEIKILNDNGK